MKARTLLRLGRVSNLPTVWTNVLAGAVLAGGALRPATLALLCVSLTLFYVGGMYLNDAFDARVDARERPERPIPSGQIGLRTVYALGGGMLAAGWLLLVPAGAGVPALVSGAALGGTILLYNAWHKGNPFSPVLMGLTRALVYVTAGLAVSGSVSRAMASGALLLLAYLIGLTYAAKQETLAKVANLWPLAFLAAPLVLALPGGDALAWALWAALAAWIGYALRLLTRGGRSIGRAVVSLIAGISLLDALFLAREGAPGPALAAVGAFGLTLLLQRVVPGT